MFPFTATLDLTANPKVSSVRGWNITETGGAAAIVNLRNGGATGSILAQIRFGAVAGGSQSHFDASKPLTFGSGLYIEVVSGAVVGSVKAG